MRTILGAMTIVLALSTAGFAANAEGTITQVDRESMTLTLDDGKTYKLSEEFSTEDFSEGMAVMISYDQINGQNIVLQIIPD